MTTPSQRPGSEEALLRARWPHSTFGFHQNKILKAEALDGSCSGAHSREPSFSKEVREPGLQVLQCHQGVPSVIYVHDVGVLKNKSNRNKCFRVVSYFGLCKGYLHKFSFCTLLQQNFWLLLFYQMATGATAIKFSFRKEIGSVLEKMASYVKGGAGSCLHQWFPLIRVNYQFLQETPSGAQARSNCSLVFCHSTITTPVFYIYSLPGTILVSSLHIPTLLSTLATQLWTFGH